VGRQGQIRPCCGGDAAFEEFSTTDSVHFLFLYSKCDG
jgi:hypothetical protein